MGSRIRHRFHTSWAYYLSKIYQIEVYKVRIVSKTTECIEVVVVTQQQFKTPNSELYKAYKEPITNCNCITSPPSTIPRFSKRAVWPPLRHSLRVCLPWRPNDKNTALQHAQATHKLDNLLTPSLTISLSLSFLPSLPLPHLHNLTQYFNFFATEQFTPAITRFYRFKPLLTTTVALAYFWRLGVSWLV